MSPKPLNWLLLSLLLKKHNRPISNLPFLSNILEKVASSKLYSFLEKNDICEDFQSGFRPSHSTETALIRAAVLNSSPRAPPLYIFFMSLLVNTPDSDNQLVRSALHEWTVFRLTCSLHSVHCSLLPEQGKAAEVYFTSEHSFMDCVAQHLYARTSVTSYTSVIYTI